MEVKDGLELTKAVERLKENIMQFNAQKIVPYTISLSLGYDYFDCKLEKPVKEFIKHIDSLMYEDKQNYNNCMKAI